MDGPQAHVLASHFADLLGGHPIDRLDIPSDRWQANVLLLNCVGQVIQRVRSHGKWLLFDFSHGISWATHLLAKSSWRIQHRPGSAEQAETTPRVHYLKSQDQRRDTHSSSRAPLLAIHLRHGPVVSLLGHPLFLIHPTETLLENPHLKSLGPDPLSTPSFATDFPPLLRNASSRTLASALLDQDILAGAGNALKCEILFGARLHPSTRVAALLASHIDTLCTLIPATYQRFVTHYARTFDPAPSSLKPQFSSLFSVYDRTHDPCPLCQSPIVVDHSSSDGRWTWYCPTCQAPLSPAPTLFT